MAQRFLVSVDLKNLQVLTDNGFDLKSISYLSRIHLTVDENTFEDTTSFLQQYFDQFIIYCDCTGVKRLDNVISLLNGGAAKVFLSFGQFIDIVVECLLAIQDLSRLVVSFEHNVYSEDDLKNYFNQIETLVGDNPIDIQIHDWPSLNALSKLPKFGEKSVQYIALAHTIQEIYSKVIKDGYVAIIPATGLTADPQRHPHLLSAHHLITSSLVSDRPDGLYPTVVVDERGVCLGLVYSTEKSIEMALQLGRGVYHSRRHGLWIKGQQSGDSQELINIAIDCDGDALQFKVRQKGKGFCHLKSSTCFGQYSGISRLEYTLQKRKESSPAGSYTARLLAEPKLLRAKIMEEAAELCEASSKENVAAETADLLYFALTKCVAAGVKIEDIERNLDLKSTKVTRRKGDAKPQWAEKVCLRGENGSAEGADKPSKQGRIHGAASTPTALEDLDGSFDQKIQMKRYKTSETDPKTIKDALQRPSQRATDQIMGVVRPIIGEVRAGGDAAVLKFTHKFEKATSLTSPVLHAPFAQSLMQLSQETIEAINVSFDNISCFHAAQKELKELKVETMPGVVCSRFSRPIEKVGLYVPGGTAVLPSTALMLGVPAMVAGCQTIILASPPRSDGTITPEIVYIAHKIGAKSIVLAGGAQAVAAMAYGTESIPKVDKILGPGNQFVTAAKMLVSNDTTAGVSIDMPAGPSEVLVIADKSANPAFVASDLLSQAEHGIDSQVILIAVGLSEAHIGAIETEVDVQANALPRREIVRSAITHSITLMVKDVEEAMMFSNEYAPEHLILQLENAESVIDHVQNAGSVFVGPWSPESVGDYSAGTNHSLPTYGYAKQYSGVNLSSFTKHITSSNLTKDGLTNVGSAVMHMAKVEQLEAHRRAVAIRLEHMTKTC